MQNIALTFSDQNNDFEYPLLVRNFKVIGGLVFVHCLNAGDAQRLLNWIVEITVDTGHLCLEIDSAVADMVVIDLCFLDQLINLKIETPTE